MVQIRYLLLPNEVSSNENGLYPIKLLAKQIHGNPKTTHTITKAIGYSPQTETRPYY